MSTAGAEADPMSDMPSASAAAAIVLAVYMPPHEPWLGQAERSTALSCASSMSPLVRAPTASKTSWTVDSRPSGMRPGRIEPP